MNDSILVSIRQFLGLGQNDEAFDTDLIILINSNFSVLNQLNVGPSTPFKITGVSELWSSFIEDKDYLELVKEFIGLKVKMIFDPPSNSFVMKAYEERVAELEWRLNMFEDKETVQNVINAYSTEDEEDGI